MNINSKNISVVNNRPIFFSHIVDIPQQSDHAFHLHDYGEIYIFISGNVDFIIDQQYGSLDYADVVISAPNVIHKPIIKSDAKYERYYIGIPMDSFSQFNLSNNPLDCFKYESLILTLDYEEKRKLISLLRKMSDSIEDENYTDDFLTYSKVFEILQLLNNHIGLHKSDYKKSISAVPDLITNTLAFLKENSLTINNVNEVAEHFHVNASYLSTLFSRSMNVTLKKYLIASKISYAKALLKDGASVSEVGEECGFCTTSHFITAFKNVTGQTPNFYKRNIANKKK